MYLVRVSSLQCEKPTHTDRTVILGNHRDAWVFGAVDPNSGTAALIEIARAFSVLRSYGRMSDMICHASWISDLGL